MPVDLSQTYVGLSSDDIAYIQYRDGDVDGIAFRIEDGGSDLCRHLVHRPESYPAIAVEEAPGLCGPIRKTWRVNGEWRVEVSGRRLTPFLGLMEGFSAIGN